MELKPQNRSGFQEIADMIPNLSFHQSELEVRSEETLPPITGNAPVMGLPVRSQTLSKAFIWDSFELEYYVRPIQEKPFKESLDYRSALFVFSRDRKSHPSDPILISAVFEDPETEIPCLVTFTAEAAIFNKSVKGLFKEEDALAALFSEVTKALNPEGLPETAGETYIQHPLSFHRTPQGAEPIKSKSGKKSSAAFWMAVLIGLFIILATALSLND